MSEVSEQPRRPRAARSCGPAAPGAAVVVAIALVELLVGMSAVLIPLLVAGPLLAAVRASGRCTAAVGLLAVAAAVALGVREDMFLSTEHVIEIAAVALGALLAATAATARDRYQESARATREALARERTALVRAEFLGRASRLLETPLEPDAMLEQMVRLAVPDMADMCFVDLSQPDGSLRGASVHAADPRSAQALRASRKVSPLDPQGEHPAAVAVRTGQAQLHPVLTAERLRSYAASEEHLRAMLRLGYASAMSVPLIARGQALGALSFLRFRGSTPYDEHDLELAREIARRATLAYDHARLFDDLRRAEGQLEAVLANLAEAVTVQAPDFSLLYVNDAAAALLNCASPEEVLDTPVEEFSKRYTLLDEDGHPFSPERYPGRLALAGEHPEPVLLRNIPHDTGAERWTVVKATPVFDESGEVVMAVNIIEDVTEARRADQHQRFLSTASKLVSSSLDVDATVDKVAWAVVPEIADWCCVDMPDDRGRVRRVALAHADPEARDGLDAVRDGLSPDPEDPDDLAHGLVTGRSLLIEEVGEDLLAAWAEDEDERDRLRQLGTRSLAVVPMVAGDRILGLITIATAGSGRRLGPSELALAEELGRRAGIAVENARVHAARTHIATTLQRSLLPPRLPVVPGLTIAARFRAAGETSEVGGDFYDLFGVEGAWMVVIGDVTGKGPGAAAITSLARYTMRTAAMYERSPARVLARLNAALAADPDRRQLCTAVCARIEGDADGRVRAAIACGGHPPPFLVREGHAEPVGPPGTLLGAFDGGSWTEAEVLLAPGDSLVLYTDGVTDTRGEHARFGQERLATLLGAVSSLDADEIASRVDEELVAFEHGQQRDDVALLVLRAAPGVGAESSLVAAAAPDLA